MLSTLLQTSPTNLSSPDSCISLASSLRCYYSGQGTENHHTLLIIPVALELIFTFALIFTNWRTGWRHLFLVAEGFLDFLLAFLEVLSFTIPAARFNVSHFKAIDQAIGALSFTPLFFSMLFLYAWVCAECLPITPVKVQGIARLLLFMVIPAVIIANMIASFVGISYVQGPNHVLATFAKPKDNFLWTFFSSVTLALLTLFKTSCFCFAFCRLIRAIFTQRGIEVTSKDAAVLFKGIGWMNGGIILGAIETIVGFVFFGIPIAYVRRVLRLFSLALICIGVAKGIDEVEDFGAIRNELQMSNSNRNFRRSKLRELISNPRLSTFRQLSPTAIAFHARPRAPLVTSQDFANAASRRDPHPYDTNGLPGMDNSPAVRTISYVPSSATGGQNLNLYDASPKPSLQNGLPGMSEFAEVREKRISERPRRRVTIYYNDGTPTLHLQLPSLDLLPPVGVAEARHRSMGNVPKAYKKFLSRTPGKPRFSTANESFIDSDTDLTYPASTVHGHTGRLYRSRANFFDPFGLHPTAPSSNTTEARGQGRGGSNRDILTKPTYLNPTERFSAISDASGLSAAHAEIVDTPRRQLSFKRGKSALARAVLYPVPGKNVAMALTRYYNEEVVPEPASTRGLPPILNSPAELQESTLATNQRLSQSHATPRQPPTSLSRPLGKRQSVVDEDGSIITVTAISPSIKEDTGPGEKRHIRKASGYSVRSIQETLQAVREMADKFPVLPIGAVGVNGNGSSSSRYRRPLTLGSTDREEFAKSRIPAEKKMKGRAVTINQPSFASGQEIQQLPSALPLQYTSQGTRLSVQQRPSPPLPTQINTKSIDSFFDDIDDNGTSQLSPLSMSIKLGHPQSLVSTFNARSTIGSPIMPVPYIDASDTIDFGTALKEWRTNSGQRIASVRVNGDLSSIVGSSRDQVTEQGKRYRIANSEILDEMPEQLEQFRRSQDTTTVTPGNGGSSTRIKSIGNVPRRSRPQPITSHTNFKSLHLHPLVIPFEGSIPKDVPISAVGVSSYQTMLGGSQEDGRSSISVTTTGECDSVTGAGDGAYASIEFQGNRKISR